MHVYHHNLSLKSPNFNIYLPPSLCMQVPTAFRRGWSRVSEYRYEVRVEKLSILKTHLSIRITKQDQSYFMFVAT